MTDNPDYSWAWDIAPKRDTSHIVFSGKYWFDRKWEAKAIVEDFIIHPDGVVTFNFQGMDYIDLTDYRPPARFLRWILRRQ